VVVGGLGVLAVIAFVAFVSFGGSTRTVPGERVKVVRADGPAGIAVLAGRCLDQRVTAVSVAAEGGDVLWRIESTKGSIERRYVVGAPAPLGFHDVTALAGPPAGRVRAEVEFIEDDQVSHDERTVDVDALPRQGATLDEGAPACGGHEGPGATALLFAAGAAVVVAGYVLMLTRLRYRR
jgi:hypothetical protein